MGQNHERASLFGEQVGLDWLCRQNDCGTSEFVHGCQGRQNTVRFNRTRIFRGILQARLHAGGAISGGWLYGWIDGRGSRHSSTRSRSGGWRFCGRLRLSGITTAEQSAQASAASGLRLSIDAGGESKNRTEAGTDI